MKKITNSNFGIVFLSIIPALISYIMNFLELSKCFKLNQMTNEITLLIGIGTTIFMLIFLFIRKWIIDKFSALDQSINHYNEDLYTIMKFHQMKTNQQFTEFYNARLNKRDAKKIKITDSEIILLNRLSKLSLDKIKQIVELYGDEFKEEK